MHTNTRKGLQRLALGLGLSLATVVLAGSAVADDGDLHARAARGDSEAQFTLAIELLGEGKKDEARIWLDAAAQNGHPKARAIADAVSEAQLEKTEQAAESQLPNVPERMPSEQLSAAPGPRVAWTGDLDLTGSFTKNVPLFRQSGNRVKFNLNQMADSRNTREKRESLRLTLRKNDNGELLLQTGRCTGQLFERSDGGKNPPREARGMRAYEVDYAVARAPASCAQSGRRKGEETTVYLASSNGGYEVYLHKSWEGEGNTAGRGELGGRGVLRAFELPPERVVGETMGQPRPQPQPLPKSTLQGVAGVVDNSLISASRSWNANRYDVGSVFDTQVVATAKDGSPSQIYSAYTYNGGMRGWAKLSMSGESVQCIEWHDFPGQCRSVGNPGSNDILVGIMTGMMRSAVVGGGVDEDQGCDEHCQREQALDDWQTRKAAEAAARGFQPEP